MKEGLEAIIFTADGDMRQALNNLQATHFGFGLVDSGCRLQGMKSCPAFSCILSCNTHLPEYKQGHAFQTLLVQLMRAWTHVI